MSRHPTIVILNDFAHERGGADQVAVNSALGLAAAGLRVIFLAAVGPVDPRLLGQPGLRCLCLGGHDLLGQPSRLRAALGGVWNTRAARAVRDELSALDPADTLVHVHCYSKALTAAAPVTASRLGFRTVLTLHDYFLGCPNGALFHYPVTRHCELPPLGLGCLLCRCDARHHAHKLWRYARTTVQNRIAELPRRLSAVLVLGETCRREAMRLVPPGTRLRMVRNPVDIPRAEPLAPGSGMPLLFIGRIEAYKGVLRLAAAARATGDRVVFCGEGSVLPELRNQYPEFEYTGRLGREGLRAAMTRCRALVFPSLWAETFGLTVPEALASGLPAIVARETAPAEFVSDGANGLLFSHGQPGSLEAALRASAVPGTAARLGAEAHRRYWAAPMDGAAHLRALLCVYTELLQERPAAPPQFGTSM